MQKNTATYRADIDGLRAVAVTAVIGYHAFPQWFSGGFVGVDVFFVISGYLITSIILMSSAKNGFSLIDFYSRRIRRIFPALIAMLSTCLLVGWILLFPDELQQLGKHALGATFFVSNFVFWSEAGYFDTASELKPLLHLWSLSIEEQFYTLWPIVLLLFVRIKSTSLCTLLLLLSSFLLCIFGELDKAANFYMPLTRIWELLCGGLLASISLNDSITNKILPNNKNIKAALAELLSLTGTTLLLLSIFYFLSNKSVFPGWLSLLPIIGTVLIIASGPRTLISHYVLGNRVFVFIGLISYSLYLWHWPFLAFPKITDGLALPLNMRIYAVAGAFIFAVITYFCIEKPLRHRGNGATLSLLVIALLMGGTGYLFKAGVIQPLQSNTLTQKIAEATTDYPLNDRILISHSVDIGGYKYWEIGSGNKTTLFIGDSNLDMYWPGVETFVSANNIKRRALLGSRSGCPPILNVYSPDREDPVDKLCVDMKTHAIALAFNHPEIDTVVLGSNWLSLASFEFDDNKGSHSLIPAEGMNLALDHMVSMINQWRSQGKQVYLLLNIPPGPEFDPHNLIKRSLSNFTLKPRLSGGISVEEYRKRTEQISPKMIEVARRSGAILLDPTDYLCHDGWCDAVTADGDPIYQNNDHLRGSFTRTHPEFIGQVFK